MNHKIVYTPKALHDLDDIWDYISLELDNPDAAAKIVTGIMDQIDALAFFPEMGTALSPLMEDENHYRFLICGQYMAFYRVDGGIICIDRVLYGKRDYLNMLFPDDSASE